MGNKPGMPGLLVFRYTLSSGFLGKETSGSPKFPSYPCGDMPRSKTPVVSQPLALSRPGLLPSGHSTPSAFPLMGLLTTTIPISGFDDAACVLAYPGSVRPLLGLHAGFTTDLLARRWSGGTCAIGDAHPLGNSN